MRHYFNYALMVYRNRYNLKTSKVQNIIVLLIDNGKEFDKFLEYFVAKELK